jgi:hypothetical protein
MIWNRFLVPLAQDSRVMECSSYITLHTRSNLTSSIAYVIHLKSMMMYRVVAYWRTLIKVPVMQKWDKHGRKRSLPISREYPIMQRLTITTKHNSGYPFSEPRFKPEIYHIRRSANYVIATFGWKYFSHVTSLLCWRPPHATRDIL